MVLDIEILGFDVYGTVVDWRTSIAREAAAFLIRHKVPVEPIAFAEKWRSCYQPSLEQVRSGQRAWVSLDLLHHESLQKILLEYGIDPAVISPLELAQLVSAWEKLDPWPDVRTGLLRLKTRYPIVTISNGHVATMIRLARHAGLPWDAILGAEVSQSYKPQPAAYLRSAELAGVKPQQIAMVAAHNDDLAAARSCGFKTIFVRRPYEWGERQTTDMSAQQDWDVTTDSFTSLADILLGAHS